MITLIRQKVQHYLQKLKIELVNAEVIRLGFLYLCVIHMPIFVLETIYQ